MFKKSKPSRLAKPLACRLPFLLITIFLLAIPRIYAQQNPDSTTQGSLIFAYSRMPGTNTVFAGIRVYHKRFSGEFGYRRNIFSNESRFSGFEFSYRGYRWEKRVGFNIVYGLSILIGEQFTPQIIGGIHYDFSRSNYFDIMLGSGLSVNLQDATLNIDRQIPWNVSFGIGFKIFRRGRVLNSSYAEQIYPELPPKPKRRKKRKK